MGLRSTLRLLEDVLEAITRIRAQEVRGLDSVAWERDDHRMEIDRNQIVEMFVMRGDLARAEQAERDLPVRVDPLAYSDALQRLGIDPALLMTLSDGLEA